MRVAVRLEGVRKRYGELEVLRGVDLEMPTGQTVAVIGPSGSGKSTLLRLLMALDRPDAGRIEIMGEPLWTTVCNSREVQADERHVRRLRGKVGMVFQHFNLFPHMTALANVIEAPMRVRRLSRAEAEALGVAQLERVGLADKRNAYPAELSGGQKQRVAIARALAMEPEIMLFDEITSALDPELVGGILRLLDELARGRRMTMLIVTHHMKFAERSSDRVLFFDQGRILEDGSPERIFRDPQEPRTRQFLDSILSSEG
ncbi:ectoine/hydroxyectoine ABC transporter ATP-binding protein EhuA [Pelomicrobium sp. G1]|uniref:ectoine/hydroxyectoine ABC transporter ATP-binding protein EhuA n=1 Tax=unclassified Pelomicrobium TaxID=2815318 RepID=UPI003F777C63